MQHWGFGNTEESFAVHPVTYRGVKKKCFNRIRKIRRQVTKAWVIYDWLSVGRKSYTDKNQKSEFCWLVLFIIEIYILVSNLYIIIAYIFSYILYILSISIIILLYNDIILLLYYYIIILCIIHIIYCIQTLCSLNMVVTESLSSDGKIF